MIRLVFGASLVILCGAGSLDDGQIQICEAELQRHLKFPESYSRTAVKALPVADGGVAVGIVYEAVNTLLDKVREHAECRFASEASVEISQFFILGKEKKIYGAGE